MAYVAISRDLISRVEHNIGKMRKAEVAAACTNREKEYILDASHIYNLSTWGSHHIHLMASIPKEWLNPQPNAHVYIAGPHPLNPQAELRTSVRFRDMSNAFARPSKDHWNRTSGEIHIDDVRALPEGTVGRAECIERWEEACIEAEIAARWQKVQDDVVEFLDKCKSLNEATKLLPAIRMYVDKGDIERMERKVVRAPREELVAPVDADGITAAAVAARLMSAV